MQGPYFDLKQEINKKRKVVSKEYEKVPMTIWSSGTSLPFALGGPGLTPGCVIKNK